jgi:hypothetical protein
MGDTDRIAALMDEASNVHGAYYRIIAGDDDDWATFYSEWLVNHSELPDLLGRKPIRAELTAALVKLDRDYSDQSPDQPWPQWYAERLDQQFR